MANFPIEQLSSRAWQSCFLFRRPCFISSPAEGLIVGWPVLSQFLQNNAGAELRIVKYSRPSTSFQIYHVMTTLVAVLYYSCLIIATIGGRNMEERQN